jgi:hypothetical protein
MAFPTASVSKQGCLLPPRTSISGWYGVQMQSANERRDLKELVWGTLVGVLLVATLVFYLMPVKPLSTLPVVRHDFPTAYHGP